MKRKCTEAEDRIIKECAKDCITRPETYAAAFKSRLFPTVLGIIAGAALGVLAVLSLSVSDGVGIRFILLMCVTVFEELFVLIWQMYIRKRLRKKKLPGDKFWVNGGTIIRIEYSKEGTYLIYAEDDLRDDMGNPCRIRYPAPNSVDVRPGERILLVYSDSDAYIPLKMTERTRYFIPERGPEYIGKVDWNEAVELPHPWAVGLDRRSSMMYEYEKMEFEKKCSSFKSIRIRNWIGIVLLSFLILFLFGILFIVLVAGDIITEFYMAIIFVTLAVLIWLFLTCKFAKAALTGRISGLKKIQYKKKVMFGWSGDIFSEYNNYTKYIAVYEYVNRTVILVEYPVNGNVFLPKNIPYGKIIYKYSKDAKSCAGDLNFFGLS